MPKRDGWKTLRPEERLVALIRDEDRLKDRMRFVEQVQGMRLEGRMVGTERHLFAVVEDPTATNNGTAYQLTP